MHEVDGPMEGKRVDRRGAGSLSMRTVCLLLALAWLVAVPLGLVNGVWPLIMAVLTMGVLGLWLGSKIGEPVAVPAGEPSFAWGLDEIPQGPAMRELALRRIRDRKSMRRAWRGSMRALSPRERRQARMGMATAVAGFVIVGWQALTWSWTPHFALAAISLGVILFLQLIGGLADPVRGWLRREDERAREDRMLRSWTPRGLERKFRRNMVLVGASLAAPPLVLLAVWLGPSLGIGVPAAWTAAANTLFVYALFMLALGVFIPIAMVCMPKTASWRRQYLALAEAMLWAPEDGADEGGAMEGGVV